jgi:ribosome-binding factor A
MSHRIKKVNELIMQEIGKIIEKEIGPDFGFITVTNVSVTPDLRIAEIWLSLYGKRIDKPEEFLRDYTPIIQKILNRKLHLKYVPKIILRIDKSQDFAFEIEKTLDKIKSNK